jgi:heavy metal sensor kinase
MSLVFLGIGFGIYYLVERNLSQSVDAALIASGESLRNAKSAMVYRSPFHQGFLREFFGEDYIRPYAQLVDLSGRVSEKTQNVRVSLPVTPEAVSRAQQGIETFETFNREGSPPLRQITMPIMRQGQFNGELVQVGAPLDDMYRTLRSIARLLWVVLPVGLLISLIIGYQLTSISLKPVRRLTKTASAMGSDDLGIRLPLPKAKDELFDLTQTFNSMLDRLEDAFSRMKRFASDVSHELRTPLTVLRGEAEFALRKERKNEEYKESLRAVLKESVQMGAIVEDLLLLARAQAGHIAMQWDKTQSKHFYAQIIDALEPIAMMKNVSIITDNADFELECSQHFLQLAVKNILLNAIKHSHEGGRVEVTTESNADGFVITVRDYGVGIDPEVLPFIFDEFYRADTARNRSLGGVGIGLSLAKALVLLHNGRIEVSSKPGDGSEFRIFIPSRLQPKNTDLIFDHVSPPAHQEV